MGKWLFRKPEPKTVCGLCVSCKVKPQRRISKSGNYSSLCTVCNRSLYLTDKSKASEQARDQRKKRPYREHLRECCEACGFVPVHKCQLDVDHIDSNHRNNEISNLQTLCANCHRLKTHYDNLK